jgi:hypothetical protein
MVRVDERVANSLARLRAEEFAPLIEWLKNCQAESLEKLSQADGNQIYRLQGEAVVLKEFLELIDRSGELIVKLRRQ